MSLALASVLKSKSLAPEEISTRTQQIYHDALKHSRYLQQPNFELIHQSDLALLFDRYDELFFEGACRRTLQERRLPLSFRISPRMTRAGGKTTRFRQRAAGGVKEYYEIAVSSTLLFETFYEVERPIQVTGLLCRDRMEALQRVFEHELMHLIEMLVWTDSNCAQARFQTLARRYFSHTQHTHNLITPRETARVKYGVKPGDHVTFEFEGCRFRGIVNRITRRATVLVPDERGERYSDGRRYRKFYIPVELLAPAT